MRRSTTCWPLEWVTRSRGRPGESLTSQAFAHNLKRYVAEAEIDQVHFQQIRHTFARIVEEETGSFIHTQRELSETAQATVRSFQVSSLFSLLLNFCKFSTRDISMNSGSYRKQHSGSLPQSIASFVTAGTQYLGSCD